MEAPNLNSVLQRCVLGRERRLKGEWCVESGVFLLIAPEDLGAVALIGVLTDQADVKLKLSM